MNISVFFPRFVLFDLVSQDLYQIQLWSDINQNEQDLCINFKNLSYVLWRGGRFGVGENIGGSRSARTSTPSRSNFFHFHAVVGK